MCKTAIIFTHQKTAITGLYAAMLALKMTPESNKELFAAVQCACVCMSESGEVM